MKNSNKVGKFAIVISLINKYNTRLFEVLNKDIELFEKKKFVFKVVDNNVLTTSVDGLTMINNVIVGEHPFVELFVNFFEPLSDTEFKHSMIDFEKQVKNFELETHSIINQTSPKQWLSDEL